MTANEGQIRTQQLKTRVPPSRISNSLRVCVRILLSKPWWPSPNTCRRAYVVLQGLLVFAVGFGFHAYLAPYGIDPHHDGIMFKPALDVSQGRMVFRDTFTQYGGVTVLLQAAALKLFGARLLVLKLQTAVTYGFVFTLFWRAWSRLIPSELALLVCFVGTVLGPDSIAESLAWSSVFALFFQGLTLLLAMRYLERGRESELVISGASAALAFWCRQPVGVFLAFGVLCSLVAITSRISPVYHRAPGRYSVRLLFGQSPIGRALGAAFLFGGGTLIVNGAILLWLYRYDALIHWWKQSIVLARLWSAGTSQGNALEHIIGCLFPWAHLRIWCFLALASLIQVLRQGAPFLDPKSAPNTAAGAKALLASAVAVMSWLQYFPVACNYHCYWGGLPMLGVFVHLFYSSHKSTSVAVRSIVAFSISGLAFYADAAVRLESVKPHIASLNFPVTKIPALRGMRASYAEATSYDALQPVIEAYLRARPDGTIVTNLGDGLFPALTHNQASYHPFWLNFAIIGPRLYPDRQAAYDRYIKEHRPIVIGGIDDPAYVLAAKLFFWGYPYFVYVPRDTNPTEYVDCDAAGACQRRPIQ